MTHITVLSIGGSDSGGGAGIQADVKTFAALDVHGTTAITAITAQNTLGVSQVFPLDPGQVQSQLEAVLEDFEIAFAKTGMLYSPEIVSLVADVLRRWKVGLVLDPVMAAEAGGLLLGSRARDPLVRELIPLAAVVTPNIFEARALTGLPVRDREGAVEAGKKIVEMGAQAAVVTGGHLDMTDVLVTADQVHLLPGRREAGGNHGVGCTYSAALTAYLARGLPMVEAAGKAQQFAAMAVARSRPAGRGVHPVNQTGSLQDQAMRFSALCSLDQGLTALLDEPDFWEFIPEVGSNLAMAVPGAAGPEDVAAVEGRLVRAGRRVHQSGCLRFGASNHMARAVLAAMKFDPRVRAAMNLRHSQEMLNAAQELGLSMASFDRRDEPEGEETMSWGVAKAAEETGFVPEIVWDGGGLGKEPMIRLLGIDALTVAALAVRIVRFCKKGDRKI
ncbi:MAG: bifunctional hydroxymethylpyrimidine kinase/phosphomethylpyrimidine kinase [Methanosarcinales archaeon]|nr:bifunctional hydroxymethylpyrimidine kinase/phosphomethylpyrimidine kinase [Methanosarcinales archaeon]